MNEGIELIYSVQNSLKFLSTAFGRTGNDKISRELEEMAFYLLKGVELIQEESIKRSQEGLQFAREMTGELLKATLGGHIK